MRARSYIKVVILSTLFCTAMLFIVANIQAQDGGLVVIANAESVPSELNKNQLNSVLKGERQRWNDGSKVIIALMDPDTPTGRNTCTRVYNMSGDELQKYFLLLVFQGKARAPNFFDSTEELEAFVVKTRGAIGVLNETTDSSVNTVLIEGNRLL